MKKNHHPFKRRGAEAETIAREAVYHHTRDFYRQLRGEGLTQWTLITPGGEVFNGINMIEVCGKAILASLEKEEK